MHLAPRIEQVPSMTPFSTHKGRSGRSDMCRVAASLALTRILTQQGHRDVRGLAGSPHLPLLPRAPFAPRGPARAAGASPSSCPSSFRQAVTSGKLVILSGSPSSPLYVGLKHFTEPLARKSGFTRSSYVTGERFAGCRNKMARAAQKCPSGRVNISQGFKLHRELENGNCF